MSECTWCKDKEPPEYHVIKDNQDRSHCCDTCGWPLDDRH